METPHVIDKELLSGRHSPARCGLLPRECNLPSRGSVGTIAATASWARPVLDRRKALAMEAVDVSLPSEQCTVPRGIPKPLNGRSSPAGKA
jgi:hypothetical protein